jgi:hypothetical protein
MRKIVYLAIAKWGYFGGLFYSPFFLKDEIDLMDEIDEI